MFGFIGKYKNIIIGIIVIGGGFFAYTYFFTGDNAPQLLTSERSETAATAVGAEILALLRDLRSIRLDDSIFSDPVFQGLEDFGQPLVPEPLGRNNPFAPIDEE